MSEARCRYCGDLSALRLVEGDFECRDRRRCEISVRVNAESLDEWERRYLRRRAGIG